jgi:hypothetical protein
MKFDPDNKIVKFMLLLIVIYVILSYVLNNFVQKDYDYDKMKENIKNSKNEKELEKYVETVNKISKTRFYLLMSVFAILFVSYIYYKTQTAKSESIAIMLAVCLSLSGKLIEKLGLANCLKLPVIDPKGSPGNVLLFDMFYTNFFAYFLDFVYAFSAVIVLTDGSKLTSLFKKDKFKSLLSDNLSFMNNGKPQFKNIIRFVLYLFVIVMFWNWGSIIRPKISLLIHRFLGIPVIDKNSLKLDDKEKEEKEEKPELVTTIPSIGIIGATMVEGLIFTGVLFPMRKFFLYSLGNESEYNSDKMMILAKFVILVLLIPICIILMTKYTLTDKDSQNNKYPKMISLILGQYILIPFVLLVGHSLFKLPIMDLIKKNKQISMVSFILIPIIITLLLTFMGKNSTNYIEDTPEQEKVVERYMSEENLKECAESENKYIYIVAAVTIVMFCLSMGPFLSTGKLQLVNGLFYVLIIGGILKFIYSFQNNYEPYNILNPARHKDKDSKEIDLDSVISIEATMTGIFISICLLVLFRKHVH